MAIQKTRSRGKARPSPKAKASLKDVESFRQFVRKVRSSEPALVLFKEHAAADLFPDAESWYEIRSYLVKAGADHEAFVGARMAWRGFRRS